MISMERIDPLLVGAEETFDAETLKLHLERYEFAAAYVPDRAVVDCACGTGYGSEILAKAGARSVTGVDISEEAIAFAREHHQRGRVQFLVDDALTFRPRTPPEIWVSLETVEHLDEPRRYLGAIYDRLAPAGLLIASVPTTVSTDGNIYHRTDFTPASWRMMVQQAGFAIEHELVQSQRFSLRDVFGRRRGPRQQVRRNLLSFYLRNPRVALARTLLTLTKGLVNEYRVVVARRTQ